MSYVDNRSASSSDDYHELNRFVSQQLQRNYRNIPPNWDGLVCSITSNLWAAENSQEPKAISAEGVRNPGWRAFDESVNKENGDTLLHLICMGFPCISAVESVLQYYRYKMMTTEQLREDPPSSIVSLKNNCGATSLHVAIQCGASEEVIRCMISDQKNYPDLPPLSSYSMNGGTFPLHIACRLTNPTVTIGVLQALVEDDPTVLKKEMNDINEDLIPLHLLWLSHCDQLGLSESYMAWERYSSNYLEHHPFRLFMDDMPEKSKEYHDRIRCELWSKVKVLLFDMESVSACPVEFVQQDLSEPKPFLPVHDLAKTCKCPPALMKAVLEIEPTLVQDLNKYDTFGKIPLHYATASIPAHKWKQSGLPGRKFHKNLVQVLLDACPRTSSIRYVLGRLPLHLLIESGSDWETEINPVMIEYPDALAEIDPKTGFFPFMIAAISVASSDQAKSVSRMTEMHHSILDLLKKTQGLSNTGIADIQLESGNKTDHKLTMVFNLLLECPVVLNHEHLQLLSDGSHHLHYKQSQLA